MSYGEDGEEDLQGNLTPDMKLLVDGLVRRLLHFRDTYGLSLPDLMYCVYDVQGTVWDWMADAQDDDDDDDD